MVHLSYLPLTERKFNLDRRHCSGKHWPPECCGGADPVKIQYKFRQINKIETLYVVSKNSIYVGRSQSENLIKISLPTDCKLSKTIIRTTKTYFFFLRLAGSSSPDSKMICISLCNNDVFFHLKEHPVKHCSSWILQKNPSDLTNLNLNLNFNREHCSRIG